VNSHEIAKSRKRNHLVFRVFVFSWILVLPRVALACPVCFGQNDSPLAAAMNLGIVFMLVIVVGVLAAFASFFIYLMRRARMAARQSESTAQC
jgi:hypothetical protein